ncbi:ATP-binding protein [Vibrio alginolyticus]|nr:ATP-binding protein [Vibrio alginolyticus]
MISHAVYLSVNCSGENYINRLHRNFLSLPYTRNQHSSHLCRQGHSVYYFRLKNLLEECYQSHADGSYPKLLGKLAKSALLIIDDWGLEPLAADQRSDLLEIIDQHYQKGSILLISQLPIEEWHRMIGDATHADAILDRLVHGSIKVNLAGESMRKVCSQLTEGDQ